MDAKGYVRRGEDRNDFDRGIPRGRTFNPCARFEFQMKPQLSHRFSRPCNSLVRRRRQIDTRLINDRRRRPLDRTLRIFLSVNERRFGASLDLTPFKAKPSLDYTREESFPRTLPSLSNDT